jgi:DNA excision repair protein ERCC-2
MGGSVAEGIDFPGEELCFAIIVGIPFPPPTLENNAMSAMYDEKYGAWMGWKYVSLAPAMRKMKQAIGRLIRTETDRGMAIIMDSRVSKYAKELEAEPTTDVLGDAARFFEGM